RKHPDFSHHDAAGWIAAGHGGANLMDCCSITTVESLRSVAHAEDDGGVSYEGNKRWNQFRILVSGLWGGASCTNAGSELGATRASKTKGSPEAYHVAHCRERLRSRSGSTRNRSCR